MRMVVCALIALALNLGTAAADVVAVTGGFTATMRYDVRTPSWVVGSETADAAVPIDVMVCSTTGRPGRYAVNGGPETSLSNGTANPCVMLNCVRRLVLTRETEPWDATFVIRERQDTACH